MMILPPTSLRASLLASLRAKRVLASVTKRTSLRAKRSSILFPLLLMMIICHAEDNEQYAANRIPLDVSKGANAVIRLDERRMVLKNLEKLTVHRHFVITVLNEKGDELTNLVEFYDKFNSIESIQGVLYDGSGKKIKTLKRSDIRDVGIITEEDLAVDGRVKLHNFYYKNYPYTVEYIVETVKKETMFFPDWLPVPDESIGVEKSSISIDVPADYKFRYTTFNYDKSPVITTKDGRSAYSWQILNYAPLTKEYASPPWRRITPGMMVAPSEFAIEDYKGNMSNWKEFGLFQIELNKGRDVLPEAVKQNVAALVKDATTRRQKVERLYQYLQQNTRYVSIQLGIGGWRPFDAAYVSSKGYGDCKALSNFMLSLLKEAGITSYYTLVKAGEGEEDILADFPDRQFNHVILCVPDDKDTIWLECTSQTVAAGYLGKFTSDRNVLLITKEGGKLVRTPKYSGWENQQVRHIKGVLEETGTLSIKVNTRYSGLEHERPHRMINSLSKDKVKEYLHEKLDFATYDISQFDYSEEKKALPVVNESLDISVSNYATITGKRLFIAPNVMTRNYRKLSQDTARKFEVVLRYEYMHNDTVEIALPPGYEAEAIPQDIALTGPFGKYTCAVKLKDNTLYYYRTMESYSGSFPADLYNDLVKFYETIYKADRSRVVLVKKQ